MSLLRINQFWSNLITKDLQATTNNTETRRSRKTSGRSSTSQEIPKLFLLFFFFNPRFWNHGYAMQILSELNSFLCPAHTEHNTTQHNNWVSTGELETFLRPTAWKHGPTQDEQRREHCPGESHGNTAERRGGHGHRQRLHPASRLRSCCSMNWEKIIQQLFTRLRHRLALIQECYTCIYMRNLKTDQGFVFKSNP